MGSHAEWKVALPPAAPGRFFRADVFHGRNQLGLRRDEPPGSHFSTLQATGEKVDQNARCIRVAWLSRVAEPWLRNSGRFGPFLESVPGPYPLLSASVEATFHAGQATAGATR